MALPSWWRKVRSGAVKDSPASLAIVNAYDRLGLTLTDKGGHRISARSGTGSYQEVRESTWLTARRVADELLNDKTVTTVHVNDVQIERPAPRRKIHVKMPPRDQLVGRKVVFPIDPSGVVADRFEVVVDVGPLLASVTDPPVWNVAFTSAGAQAWGLGDAYKGTVSLRAPDKQAALERFVEQFGSKFVVTSVSRMPTP